jgi:nucleoside-diphosphate-sugar epimerase
MKIAATGDSGKFGRNVVRRLEDDRHEVATFDRVGARSDGVVLVDLTDHGQVADALQGIDEWHAGFDALVHLAAVPAPGILPDVATGDRAGPLRVDHQTPTSRDPRPLRQARGSAVQ